MLEIRKYCIHNRNKLNLTSDEISQISTTSNSKCISLFSINKSINTIEYISASLPLSIAIHSGTHAIGISSQAVLVACENKLMTQEMMDEYKRCQLRAKMCRPKGTLLSLQEEYGFWRVIDTELKISAEPCSISVAEYISASAGLNLIIIMSMFCDIATRDVWIKLVYIDTLNDNVLNATCNKMWLKRQL